MNEESSLLGELHGDGKDGGDNISQLTGLFDQPTFVPISSLPSPPPETPSFWKKRKLTRSYITSTLIGSTVFLLYHVVFCLAQAATIVRPHSQSSSTGTMAKLAALGVFFSGPVFLWSLADKIPAIYPASDLFLAPFLAELATRIDATLVETGQENDDRVFMATFSVLLLFGFLFSGFLCVCAARIKLANLGAFLPYPVLCGFFTTIGILMWTLGISVDTGHKIGEIIRDPSLWWHSIVHHSPSVVVGFTMHGLGKQHPLLVILLVITTVAGFWVIMLLTNTSLKEAQDAGWFFSTEDFVSNDSVPGLAPPLPFGPWGSLWRNDVSWSAFLAGLPPMISLAFLYLIRSSLHSAALKKNVSSLTRKNEPLSPSIRGSVDPGTTPTSESTKVKTADLGFILEKGYGYSQLASSIAGGITVAPSVAASLTLFQLGAEHEAPQYGSCLLVLLFYTTNFAYVQYVPKPAFSCLMVLAGLDMCKAWIIGSYSKTKAKLEWMVAPMLVFLAFAVGLLNAIGIGIGMSTFIFVANFYRAGLVRFVGTGLTLRSTVERGVHQAQWLDQHGDLIQILVLQNYIFFGNAISASTYIHTMFESEEDISSLSPPTPRYLVIDFTLVSGMDNSAVDILGEIVELCKTNRCRLYMAGVAPSLKSMILFAGLKPDASSSTSHRQWSFTNDIESALSKAEDGLLSTMFHVEDKNREETNLRRRQRSNSKVEDGFLYSLKKIDEQHGLNTLNELANLQGLTEAVELDEGEVLVRHPDDDHGLYFVETGLMRVVRGVDYSSMNLTSDHLQVENPYAQVSLGHLNARSSSVGRQDSILKEHRSHHHDEQAFRLARIGQGWVIGSIETSSGGFSKPGVHVAIAPCRLHHLRRSKIVEAEQKDPRTMMNLYKLVSRLSSKRQEKTIEQLGQFFHILTAPVPRLRGGGKEQLGKIQAATIF